jgi:hypothetical protein
MAKNKSFIKLEGTLDGLTFYQKDGESFVKTKGGVSRDRILNDPNYKRTRENMQEFSGCAKAGKALREAFATVVKLMGDSYISSRLTGVMKKINKNGTGLRGERTIDIVSNKEQLIGFEFNPKDPFSSKFYAPYDAPVLGASRNDVTVTIPDFDAGSFINPPEGATHCKIVLASGLVSNFEYETALDSYEPDNEEENGKGGTDYSDPIVLQGAVGSDTVLTVAITLGSGGMTPSVSNVIALGIIFYQEINGDLYELASGNGMQVIMVG